MQKICEKFAKNSQKIREKLKFAKYLRKIREKVQKHSRMLIFRKFFANFSRIFREYFANILQIFRKFFANILRIFRDRPREESVRIADDRFIHIKFYRKHETARRYQKKLVF